MSTESNSCSSIENNVPSFKSRRSFIKGTPPFIWDNELVRSDQPYVAGNYHLAHNPPPNEVNFVDGIGKRFGRPRSKVHPSRPTTLQKIYGMRNQNMILHSFTQPVNETVCRVPKTKANTSPKLTSKRIRSIVKKITSVDMVTTGAYSSSNSSTSNVADPSKKLLQSPHLDTSHTDQTIDGKPFFYTADSISSKLQDILTRSECDDQVPLDAMPYRDEDQFRAWALNERARFQGRASMKDDAAKPDDLESYVTGAEGKKKLKRRFNSKHLFRHITGYMYGPFTRPPSPDRLTHKDNKFGIPNTMTDRAKRHEQLQTIQEEVLRNERMDHMGFKQPPSREDSSDENDTNVDVKKLSLIRTPYFSVPTVKINKVKRMNKFRNKFLQKDRLTRINLLLRDEKDPSKERSKTSQEHPYDVTQKRKQSVLAKFKELAARKKTRPEDRDRDPEKEKYYDIIKSKFVESRDKCESAAPTKSRITFGQFKNFPGLSDLQKLTSSDPSAGLPTDLSAVPTNETEDPERAKSLRSRFSKSQPRKLFQRSRNERLSQLDELVGPFYIDPNLMDKFRSPKKFKTPQKYYTNLMKGKFWIRDRLQVNGPSFEEEKIGVGKDKYFSRLATEWDEYYLHDLRNRPRVRKFCVKTDILTIRDITRRNYIMYNVQENLMNMQQVRREETQLMDEVEQFHGVCDELFVKWKTVAYDKVVQAHARLKDIQEDIKVLSEQKSEKEECLDKMNLEVFLTEKRWNFLMKLQNYYYLVQDTQWRETHDWIHRDPSNNLLAPMEAIQFCTIRNIRPEKNSCAFNIQRFYDTAIVPNLERMRMVQPKLDNLKKSLDTLNAQSMERLAQHNVTFWTYKGILGMCSRLLEQITKVREEKQHQLVVMKEKQRFIEQSGQELRLQTLETVRRDLPGAVKSSLQRKILAISTELHNSLFKTTADDVDSVVGMTAVERFDQIHLHAQNILQQMDAIPLDILKASEKFMRAHRKMREDRTAEALIKQKRYDLMKRQIENHFSAVARFKRVNLVAQSVGVDNREEVAATDDS